jgi:hypothetical protein
MADQKQKQSLEKKNKAADARLPGGDDPRHAPESGEPCEIDDVEERGARGDHAGDRDESGRQGDE